MMTWSRKIKDEDRNPDYAFGMAIFFLIGAISSQFIAFRNVFEFISKATHLP